MKHVVMIFTSVISIFLVSLACANTNKKKQENIPSYQRNLDSLPNEISPIKNEYIGLIDTVNGKDLISAINYVLGLETLENKNVFYVQKMNLLFDGVNLKSENLISVNQLRVIFRISLPQAQLLSKNRRFIFFEKNYLVKLHRRSSKPEKLNNQQIPWGILRTSISIKPDKSYPNKAWIIDTGVEPNHSDLSVDKALSKSFFPGKKYDDVTENGDDHGTHVAGIISAKNNSTGVVGIAPGAKVVALKIISDNIFHNDYYLDALIEVRDKGSKGDVLNISLQNTPGTDAEITLINQIADKGIKVVISAGNFSLNVDTYNQTGIYPARINHPNIYTVSSCNSSNTFSSFSNYGESVDYSAPGQEILSTIPGNQWGYKDGTSMSAPHLSGLLLLNKTFNTDGVVSNDPDGKKDLIVHE